MHNGGISNVRTNVCACICITSNVSSVGSIALNKSVREKDWSSAAGLPQAWNPGGTSVSYRHGESVTWNQLRGTLVERTGRRCERLASASPELGKPAVRLTGD